MKKKSDLNLKNLKNINNKKKRNHDINASIRFLENLRTEISLTTNLADIQDPFVLKKFDEVIKILKNEVLT